MKRRFSAWLRRIGSVAAVLGAAAAPASAAVLVDGLFEVELAVTSQAPEEREQAIRAGLAKVLVRVTGSTAAAQAPEWRTVIRNAQNYVQQFRYQALAPDPAVNPLQAPGFQLWMRFDQAAIEAALRERGQTAWGPRRPLVLVWMAMEDQLQRRMLGEADAAGIAAALVATARDRAIPLAWPLLDAEDLGAVTVGDVWGGFIQQLLPASRRYGADAVLMARMQPEAGGGWTGRFQLLSAEALLAQGECAAFLHEDCLRELMQQAADALAAQFAVVVAPGSPGTFEIGVSGVASVAHFRRVVEFLGGLSTVDRVEPLRAQGDMLFLRLHARGGADAVRRLIELGGPLQRSAGPVEPDGITSYRLAP